MYMETGKPEGKAQASERPRDQQPVAVATYNAASCQIQASAWHVHFVFGDAQLVGEDGIREVPRMVIAVPWPLAKVLHRVLGTAIEMYEEREGHISVPRTIQMRLDQQSAAARDAQKA